MRFRPPNPVSLLFGPIFQKEVRVMGRRRGTYVSRMLLPLGMLAIVSLFFVTFFVEYDEGIERLQMLQTLAPTLTLVVMWFLFVVLAMMAPMLTSDGISEERRARTLSALLTTPLTASQIVFGKLSSRLVQIVILSMLAVPLLFAIRIFGGVSAEVLIASSAVILSTAVLGASLGLMVSLWMRGGARASGAAMQAVLLLGILQFGPWIMEELRQYFYLSWGLRVTPLHNIAVTSSPLVLAQLNLTVMMGTEPAQVRTVLWPGGPEVHVGPLWLINSGYNLLLALCAAIFTSLVLRCTMRRLAQETPVAKRSRFWFRRGGGSGEPESGVGEQGAGGAVVPRGAVERAESEPTRGYSRVVTGNPVLWREIRQQTMGSRRRLFLATGGIVLVGTLLYWRVPIDEDALHISIATIGILLVMLRAAYATSGSIASEREGQTWEALLATPLTARQIVFAKFAGALRVQWFYPAAILAHFVIAVSARAVDAVTLIYVLVILAGPVILLTATGQFFALTFRRNSMASGANLLFGIVLFLGSWIALGGLAILVRHEPPWFEQLSDALFAVHPVTQIASATVERSWTSNRYYPLLYGELSPAQFALVTMAVFAGNVMLAWGVLALACGLFRRFTGRTS